MKGLTARWSFREESAAPSAAPLIERLLAARGLGGGHARAFLHPSLRGLHDPSIIPDLDRAAARILDAARSAEPIVLYGDYDVDGITGVAILYHMIRAIAPDARVSTYVPHRIDEGYGLNSDAIRELAAPTAAKVIVSVDCGVTAVEPARVAHSLGIDLIITDHHNPPATIDALPPAYAVVHPRRPDSTYPFGDLSGAGVAYKLAWRLATMHAGSPKVHPDLRELLVELLAFAALGTIADIVPLLGENRVLARFGLVRARHSPFVGLRALVEASGLANENIGELEVGFRLGPRLNAAGRIGHAREAVELFTTATPDRAREIAGILSTQNDARRRVEHQILEDAVRMVEAAGMHTAARRAIVLAHDSWHAGVVGIVCSRLVERFHRPTILMQRSEGRCHGSARSVDGFDLHAALTRCAAHLDKFGGHMMAAGLQLADSKLADFTEAFTAEANAAIAPDRLCPGLVVDCEAAADELTVDSVREVESLAPFGAGNPSVRLLVRGLRLSGDPRPVGAEGKHLSLRLRAGESDATGRMFRAIAWNWGTHAAQLHASARLDVVITPRVSTWNGSTSVEAEIRDVALHN